MPKQRCPVCDRWFQPEHGCCGFHSEPELTVADVLAAIAAAAPGADELNEQLRDSALNVNLDLRLR